MASGDSSGMRYLNRAAIVVTPKPPLFEWVQRVAPLDGGYEPGESDQGTVYLVRTYTYATEVEPLVKRHYRTIFLNELTAWITDPTLWPAPLTYRMFREWFDIQIDSEVIDLLDEPLATEEL